MKLSVVTTTYNQERYIAQAVESALAQKTSFDYEIVIGEDDSTDRTREIISELAEKYPEKIRLLFNDPDDAASDRARGLSGKRNFARTLQSCESEYIALLDGDDYWTDHEKLQKQVDFLETNRNCVICFHNVLAFYEDSGEPSHLMCSPDQQPISSLEDVLQENFMPACSVVFRNHLYGELPVWFYSSELHDWPLHVMNARHGDIGYLDETMANYRVLEKALWSGRSYEQRVLVIAKLLVNLNHYLGFQYEELIQDRLREIGLDVTRASLGLRAEIAESKRENLELRSNISALVAVRDDLQTSLAERDASLAERTAAVAQLETSLAERTSSVVDLQASLAETTASVAKLQTSLAENTVSLAESREAAVQLQATLAESRASVAQLQASVAQLQAFATQLQAVLASPVHRLVDDVYRAAQRIGGLRLLARMIHRNRGASESHPIL
jgi:glycosyltransferase involved in cell wall biosynthesis